jgi:hypothetical protein
MARNDVPLPGNQDLERLVLGACFVDEATMSAARNMLECDDFSIEKIGVFGDDPVKCTIRVVWSTMRRWRMN